MGALWPKPLGKFLNLFGTSASLGSASKIKALVWKPGFGCKMGVISLLDIFPHPQPRQSDCVAFWQGSHSKFFADDRRRQYSLDSDIVASLVARIRSRERLYVGAFNADMSRLRAEFGHSPVAEALRRLETSERYQPKDRWD